jgi:hypothetical protein
MLIHTRKLLLSIMLGGACATTASAQELLINPNGQPVAPPPIAGVQETIPDFTTGEIAEATPQVPTTILAPVPDDGTATVRVSDCPQDGSGLSSQGSRHRSPTAGWTAPGVIPLHRMWVPYHKFFPNPWMGQPVGPQARLPVIYMPTDTTQLGYYYQHVPHWHSYANMVPPVPRPVDWHYKYQPARVISSRRVGTPTPSEDLGRPQPMPEGEQPAPPPPPQSDLDKSAAAPELLPLMR